MNDSTTVERRRASVPADLKGPEGIDRQPVSEISWVPRDQVRANDYNPNKVYPPEMRLLKISLLSDGWTQPIVVRCTNPEAKEHERIFEVVDGYHRWLASEDKRIAKMTDGRVPVAVLSTDLPPDHQRMSTIRHNRARGEHVVVGMADIVADLSETLPPEEIQAKLQMEPEEYERLRARGNMRERGAGESFNKGWVPR